MAAKCKDADVEDVFQLVDMEEEARRKLLGMDEAAL